MEMTPNVHPDDDLPAIAADLYEALFAGAGWARGMTARLRYERWLREQQAAHPVRRKQDVNLLDTPVLDVVDHVEPLGTAVSYEGDVEVV